jgi:hypothetical protein
MDVLCCVEVSDRRGAVQENHSPVVADRLSRSQFTDRTRTVKARPCSSGGVAL